MDADNPHAADLPRSRKRHQRIPLCRLMRSHGWTQRELAMALPVPQPDLARYMAGTAKLTPYWLVRIGTVMELTDRELRYLTTGAAFLEYARYELRGATGYRRPPLDEATFTRPRRPPGEKP